MTTRQYILQLQDIVLHVLDSMEGSHRSNFQKISDQLAAMSGFPWAKSPLAAGELANTAAMLRVERLRQGLSLQDIQATTGISPSTLCLIEKLKNGKPSIATLERIAGALGMTLLVVMVKKEGQNGHATDKPGTMIREPAL